MNTFQERLEHAMAVGNLTVADLARWFEVPYQTVRGWTKDGHEPSGGPIDCAFVYAKTAKLERAIRKKDGLPLPRLTGESRRIALISARDRAFKNGR